MRSIDHPAEITKRDGRLAANAGRASLRGFWRHENSAPSEPKLIVGDREKFERDLAAYKKRQARKLTTDPATRWWIEAHVCH